MVLSDASAILCTCFALSVVSFLVSVDHGG